MSLNKINGDLGEKEVAGLVPCPNCGKKLMLLPPNYPLYDLQCTGCNFRAQVKTNKSKPKKEIFGAGWQIMEKVLKSGFITPPLITNFKWTEKGEKKFEFSLKLKLKLVLGFFLVTYSIIAVWIFMTSGFADSMVIVFFLLASLILGSIGISLSHVLGLVKKALNNIEIDYKR